MKFLKYIITPEHIKINLKKIVIIKDWKIFINIKARLNSISIKYKLRLI